MTTSMDSVTFREITMDDYELVMQIRRPDEVYNGFDYLPDYYMLLLKTLDYKGYVAEIGGRIIAFQFACLLDDGTTFFSMAHRVSKEYSGKGVIGRLSSYVLKQFRSPKLIRSTTLYNEGRYYQTIEAKVLEGTMQLVHKKDIFSYEIPSEQLKNTLKRTGIPAGVEDVSRDELQRVFNSKTLSRHLFPDNRLVIDWVPFHLFNSNIQHIFTERCSVFGTNIKEGTSNLEDSLITFGNFINIKLKLTIIYRLDVYGTNMKALHGHIIAHLKQLDKLLCEQLLLQLFLYGNVKKNDFDEITTRLGFVEKEDFFEKQLFCTDTVLDHEK